MTIVRLKKLIKKRKKPLIALPTITVILNQAGFLINGHPVRDTLSLFTSLVFHLFVCVTASPVLLHTRSAWSLIPYEYVQLLPHSGRTYYICVAFFFRATRAIRLFFKSDILQNIHDLINMHLWTYGPLSLLTTSLPLRVLWSQTMLLMKAYRNILQENARHSFFPCHRMQCNCIWRSGWLFP